MFGLGRLALAAAVIVALALAGRAVAQESGYQTIQGTRVFTQIDHAADTATFSNACGSQTISHRDLAAGAIPTNIIPCPRPNSAAPPPTPTPVFGLGSTRSYARTCPRCAASNGILSCQCRRIDQSYMPTSIRLADCAGDEIENIDGRLRCTPMGSEGTRPAAPVAPAGKAPLVEGCLQVGDTKVVSGSMGECQKANGSTGHWNFTWVRSSGQGGCPKEIDFQYFDPDTGKTESYSTPFNVQLCDARPQRITIGK
jgi:hypothetical protein